MVVLDAVVTDGQGKPVTGLTADDFEVLEDSKRQTVSAFEAKVPLPPGTVPSAHHPRLAGFYTNITELYREEGPPVIVLLDALNTEFADQVYMRAELASYLKKLGWRRNVAIYTLDRRLHQLQGFTDDPQIQQEAAARFRSKSDAMNPSPNDTPGRLALDSLSAQGAPPGQLVGLAQQITQAHTQIAEFDMDYRIRTTMRALRGIASNCAGYPGRKNLIWLSAAFPLSISVLNSGPYYEEFRKTANLLTDAETAVYPVDARGLVAFDPREMEAGMKLLVASHFSMNYIAGWTGGRAIYDRNDLDNAIGEAVEDGSTYYLLGYYPTNAKWNGELRKTQVNVLRKGLQVRYRNGYFATDFSDKKNSHAEAALKEFVAAFDADSPNVTALPVTVHVIPPASDHSQMFLDIAVDAHSVLFKAQPNGRHQSRLQFVTVVRDAKDKTVTTKFDTLDTNLTPQTFAKVMASSLAVRQKFDLAAGKYLLRVGVRDAKSNFVGTLTAPVEIAATN